MKAFTTFKFLTLASLLFYTGQSFGGDTIVDSKAQADAAANKCAAALSASTQLKIPQNGTATDYSLDVFKTAQKNNPKAYQKFTNCLNGDSVTSNTSGEDAKCERARDAITKDVEALDKDCKSNPRVDTDKLSDDTDVINTADPATAAKSKWGRCLQNATSCKKSTFGDNDSADKCTEQSLEELSKTGVSDEKLKSFCQDNYPASCGAMNKTDLKTTARDLDKDLTSELSDLQKDIVAKKQEIQENQDKLIEADKKLQALPAKFTQQTKDLQKQYEAFVAANNLKLDASLENYYKAIASDQNAIRIAASAVTMADAASFDAKNKFVGACKAKAKAMADKEYPSGGVNYGGQNALITSKSRWADYYQKQLDQMYYGDDVSVCDNGNYANSRLALLNAEKAQADAQSQLLQDQNQLSIALQQVASKKGDAGYKALTDQADKVNQLAAQQKDEYTGMITERQKLQKKAIELPQELAKIEAKVTASSKKRQCIQTMRSCASVPGIPNGSSKDVPDLEMSISDVDNIIKECRTAAKSCNSAQLDDATLKSTSITKFNTDFPLFTGVDRAKILTAAAPFDVDTPSCEDAIASKMEANGSVIDKTKKTKGSGTSK